jgi:licheninase
MFSSKVASHAATFVRITCPKEESDDTTAHPSLKADDTAAAPPSLCDAGGGWAVAWEDDFDGPLDHTMWTVPTGLGGSLGRDANLTEEDTYTQDGMLVLRSRARRGGQGWTTGAAITDHRQYKSTPGNVGAAWRYGRFCVRAKLPGAGPGKSAGLWPAHWMMPSDYSRHCGYNEMDIMEMVDGNGAADGTYWYWGPNATGSGPPGSNCSGPPVRAGSGSVKIPDYWTAFHEFAVEWTPTKLTFLVDQKPYKS